jgi:uncharacterized protein
MRERIAAALEQIEAEHRVRILYACESGSRAWGFASTDSDYDVRFIYARPRDWYLSVFAGRDVIELPIDDVLDVNGWDLRKSLQLLEKSNPTLLEWIQSPIVYRQEQNVMQRFREIATGWFAPVRGFHHYLAMANGNFRGYLQGETVRMKKYFYVLRPLLCCQWIAEGKGMPPIEFQRLVDAMVRGAELRAAIDDLLHRKRRGAELDEQPRIPVLNDFIANTLAHFQGQPVTDTGQKPDVTQLDVFFRASIG